MLLATRTPNVPALNGTTFERRISRLFNDVFGNLDWQYRDGAAASWVPAVDIVAEQDAIRIMTEVPGVKPENLKITVENNLLTIHGSKEQVRFERSFTLPAAVDADKIQASYEHGVLTVTLPKHEQAKPREIAVQVTSK